VSRKFIYHQAHKARVALDDAFSSGPAEDEVPSSWWSPRHGCVR